MLSGDTHGTSEATGRPHAHVVYGGLGADVLQVTESPVPEPRGGSVDSVHGAGLNPIDWKTRKAWVLSPADRRPLPWTPGYDAAGEVVAVADDGPPWLRGTG